MYIDKVSLMGDKLININLENIMIVSIGYSGSSETTIISYSLFTNFFPDLTNIISKVSLQAEIAKPYWRGSQTSLAVNRIWFYVRCAFSLDLNKYYAMMRYRQDSNFITSPSSSNIENDLTLPFYSVNNPIDYPQRQFFSDTTKLIISNAQNISTNVYLRNLYVFSKYIKPSILLAYL